MLAALLGVACSPQENGRSMVAGSDCSTCHAEEAEDTASPPHAQARFAETCGDCHNEEAWSPAPGFQHTPGFPLTNAHATPPCAACHYAGYVPGQIPNECIDCHAKPTLAQANQVVSHNGLSDDCFACHRTDGFFPDHFVHAWPLEGKHDMIKCLDCHPGDDTTPAPYAGISTACVDCHSADLDEANANVTGHSGFGDNCGGCHTPAGW